MEAGELVAQRYRLTSVIGRGAMGVVWLARDERLDRDVAVKQLVLDESADPAAAEQVAAHAMREARIAARLRHPNVIAVHDVVTHDGRPCLIMEYLHSDSLDAVMLARGGALPAAEVAAIGTQVAAALAAAHAAGIVHRDVKPENVLITQDGTAKLTDFGVSRAAGVGTVTTTGMLAGTPAYLAPEVAGGAKATPASDVFSLGATLYAAVEGLPPFGLDENPIVLLHRAATGVVAPPRRAGPLTEPLLWLLRRDPTDRPTMRDAHEALSALTEGRPVAVPRSRTPTMTLPARPRRSRRAVVAGLAAVALVAAGVVLGAALSGTSGGTAAPPSGTPTTEQPVATRACVASYAVVNSWPNGYQAEVTIRNDGVDPLTGWAVRWRVPAGHDIDGLWNGALTRDGADVTVRNLEYNVTIPAGGETTFGFTASADDNNRPAPEPTCTNP